MIKSKEVLFNVDGIKVIDIKSFEDNKYIEMCSTCGGDSYYTKSLYLIDENQCEHEVNILKDSIETFGTVPLTFLTKLLSDEREKEIIELMSIEEFEDYLKNSLFIYNQLDYVNDFKRFNTYIEFLENEYFNSYIKECEVSNTIDDFYYEYPKVLKEEYLQAAIEYYKNKENEK